MTNDSNLRKLTARFRVTDGDDFRLSDIDPSDTGGLDAGDKPRALRALERGVQALSELQATLYADDRWSLLVIFQAMDAAGKDGAIKHVLTGVNPQGCHVTAFKQPSATELDHDFLWRCQRELPERGRIGIFNRSYYEEVLVVRVHSELLATQQLPAARVDKKVWDRRYASIRDFERHLDDNGTRVVKFFLHVSKAEQKKRFLERLDRPDKNWKFSTADVRERSYWKDYMSVYEKMIRATATVRAPWYVIPADAKWFTRIIVASAMVEALRDLDLRFPKLDRKQRAELDAAREALESE